MNINCLESLRFANGIYYMGHQRELTKLLLACYTKMEEFKKKNNNSDINTPTEFLHIFSHFTYYKIYLKKHNNKHSESIGQSP